MEDWKNDEGEAPMNIRYIALVVLLGAVKVSAAELPRAIYASWKSTGSADVLCPDPSSGLDPMGMPLVVSKTISKCKGGFCDSTTAAGIIVAYPSSKMCHYTFTEDHILVFASMLEAGEFRLNCAVNQCFEWKIRDATDKEMVIYELARKGWMIDHVPQSSIAFWTTREQDGIWRVWPTDEQRFEYPLGQGPTPLDAIADAIRREKS
jgi:hypothetical protein